MAPSQDATDAMTQTLRPAILRLPMLALFAAVLALAGCASTPDRADASFGCELAPEHVEGWARVTAMVHRTTSSAG